MKRLTGILLFTLLNLTVFSQKEEPQTVFESKMDIDKESGLSIGGYGQIDFNLPLNDGQRQNAILDVHRMVLLFGYQFNEKTSFITEVEMEHVSELYVEQAYLNHRFFPWLNLKAGLILIPMGIINEFHEPTTFHGVERPNLDGKVVPTTWREIGAGFHGNLFDIQTKYQFYIVNGFKSYDGGGILRGSDALRKGRQKGAESISSHPNFSAKIDYYGISGLMLGLSAYAGKSQSTLFNGLETENTLGMAKADSSVVSMMMTGFDARYQIKGFELRGQYIWASLGNTDEYNALTGKDLGSSMNGFYIEGAYNVLQHKKSCTYSLIPFIRYEQYDTHASTSAGLARNNAYNRTEITMGIDFKLTPNAVLKGDYQILKTKGSDDKAQLNFGVAITF